VLACGGSYDHLCSFRISLFGLTVLIVDVDAHVVFSAAPLVLMHAPLLLP
jgi:hypothetical protein